MAKQGFWSKLFRGEQPEEVTYTPTPARSRAPEPTRPRMTAEQRAELRARADLTRAMRTAERDRAVRLGQSRPPVPERSASVSTRRSSTPIARTRDDGASQAAINTALWSSLANSSYDSGAGRSSSCDPTPSSSHSSHSSSHSYDSGSSHSSSFDSGSSGGMDCGGGSF